MAVTRRDVFLGTAGVLTLTAVGAPRPARAEAPVPTEQVVGAQRRKVGDALVTAVSDGYTQLGPDVVPNATADDLRPLFERSFIDMGDFKAAVNAYVVQAGRRTVLIDAGGAHAGFPTLGRLEANLAAIGVDPAAIDVVLATHLHPDHVGGVITANGAAAFANAELIVSEADHAFWHDDSNMNAVPEAQRAFFTLARDAVAAYDGRVTQFSGETEIVPGLTSVPLHGHTPGHTGFTLASGDEQLLIWGDVVHLQPVQFDRPEYYVGFDVNPEEAVATRRRAMDRAASDRVMVAGMHLPFPGLGHVARAGEGYAFVPAPFAYEV